MVPIGSPAHITGTTDDGLIHAGSATLLGVVVGTEVAAQTLSLHDCATEAAAAAGNKVATIKLDTRDSFHFFGARFRVGLVAIVSGGAPDITVVWA